jgi:hypothetical protein
MPNPPCRHFHLASIFSPEDSHELVSRFAMNIIIIANFEGELAKQIGGVLKSLL